MKSEWMLLVWFLIGAVQAAMLIWFGWTLKGKPIASNSTSDTVKRDKTNMRLPSREPQSALLEVLTKDKREELEHSEETARIKELLD